MASQTTLTTYTSKLSDAELALLWAVTMRALRTRELVRSSNNPVADFAERYVESYVGGRRVDQSVRGYDVIGPKPKCLRYQVKGRRLTPENPSRQLSAIRNIDAANFDFVFAVIFDELLNVQEMWSIPHVVVSERASYRAHTNSYTLHASGALLRDPRVKQLV